MNDPIPSFFRRHRVLLLVSIGIVWLLVLLGLLAWWLLPRWAPDFTVNYAPLPDMVFRAAIDGEASPPAAIQRLYRMGSRATPTLIAQLHHSNDKARSMALEILGYIQDFRATEPILALLNDPRENLHGLAIRSLGELGDPRAIPPLIQLLPHKVLGGEASRALSFMPGTSVGDTLHPLLERREQWALMILGDSIDPRVPAWLDAEMRRLSAGTLIKPETWQKSAAQALAHSPQPACSELLLRALTDTSPTIRQIAASSMHNVIRNHDYDENSPVITALITLLTDPDPSVAEEASRTLSDSSVYLTDGQRAQIDRAKKSVRAPSP